MKPVHFAFKHALSRRSFLRGLGVSLALPMLDAMRPAFGAPALAAKRRMVAICTSFGVHAPTSIPRKRDAATRPRRTHRSSTSFATSSRSSPA
jgi:hypothetical protein